MNTMNTNNSVKNRMKKGLVFFFVLSLVFNANLMVAPEKSTAQAATNLIKGASLESEIDRYWEVWNGASTSRAFEFYRSYDVPFGQGSYSGAISASGMPVDNFQAFFFGDAVNNKFLVTAGQSYYLTFYAKANQNLDVILMLDDAVSYSPITAVDGKSITTEWQRYSAYFTPTASTNAILAIALGGLPNGAQLLLDGFFLSSATVTLGTPEIGGYIGETNRCLRFNDIGAYTQNEIEIELPYYDSASGVATTKRFRPESVTVNTACVNMYHQTYSGIGKAIVNGAEVGQFNYTVKPKLDLVIPTVPLADEDITIEGTGFSPIDENTYVVLKAINNEGRIYDYWTKPQTIDSALSRLVVKTPMGVAAGALFVETSYLDTKGNIKKTRSNSLNYNVKPVIYSLDWSRRGFDQVGDSVRIAGKAISNNPTVIFYSDTGAVIAQKRAKVVSVAGQEVIEVATPTNLNQLTVTVKANGAESDKESALVYSAKPRLVDIDSSKERIVAGSTDRMPAAKIGEEINLDGDGFLFPNRPTLVEFQGLTSRFTVEVPAEKIAANGKYLKVTVPATAQSGYLAVVVNGMVSNYLPIEIIPTVIGISPDPFTPGQDMTITANGVGSNINLATVIFAMANKEEASRQPKSILLNTDGTAVITVSTPLAVSSQGSTVKVQYNMWRSDGVTSQMVAPRINEAGIEPDSNILVIKGYGFSINPKENVITYKYADQARTVVTPATKMLGVFSTEEGQEIRVQILDDYHYGYVSVTVSGQSSNEYNFGPVQIRRVARRVEYVRSIGREMGVLYISGYNFGPQGGVMVGSHWADVHYRSEFFIIAVVEPQYLYDNPVIVARQ